MRLEPSEPQNESQFYTRLRERTRGDFFFERIEPSNESGFPDIYFVRRNSIQRPNEGTIELKIAKTELPNLRSLCRGTQKASLIDYFEAGGRRRFALCYAHGMVFLWDTLAYRRALLSESLLTYTSQHPLEHTDFVKWLSKELEVK